MKKPEKYSNFQEMKADSKPAGASSVESQERHGKFEGFIRSLRNAPVKEVSTTKK